MALEKVPPTAFEGKGAFSRLPGFLQMIENRLETHNVKGYLVGGSVRDLLLGKEAFDWDLAVDTSLENLRRLFRGHVTYEFKDLVFSIILSGHKIEISPLKGGNILEDLSYRDFTINAMALDLKNMALLDPYGGRKDLERGVLKAVGDAVQRFREDPLRLLRAIRFQAELKMCIERDTFKTIRSQRGILGSVSKERIRDELKKILLTSSPYGALWQLVSTGLMAQCLPLLERARDIRQSFPHTHRLMKHIFLTVEYSPPSFFLRLAALLHDIAKPETHTHKNGRHRFLGHHTLGARLAGEVMTGLKFPRPVIEHCSALVRHHLFFYHPSWSDKAVRRFLRRIEPLDVWELIALRRADIRAQGAGEGELISLREFEERLTKLCPDSQPSWKRLEINGNDVMELLNIGQGPMVGKIMKTLKDWVMEHPEENRQDSLLRMAKDIYFRLK